MLKAGGYVSACYTSMTRNLFSGHITSGVKLAGMHLGRLYGTREVAIVLLTLKKGSRRIRIIRDSGGGLNRSSVEAFVMKVERRVQLIQLR